MENLLGIHNFVIIKKKNNELLKITCDNYLTRHMLFNSLISGRIDNYISIRTKMVIWRRS